MYKFFCIIRIVSLYRNRAICLFVLAMPTVIERMMSLRVPHQTDASFLLCLALVVTTLGPGPASAEDGSLGLEITPYLGYRFGGSFSEKDGNGKFDLDESDTQGIMLSGRVQPNTQWEILYGRQSTDVDTHGLFVDDPSFDIDVDYIHFGGTYQFEGDGVRPFIAFTLGVTHFDPGPRSYGSESFASASIGGGWQLKPTSTFGVRLEVRAYTTFIDNNSDIFCQSDAGGGACLILVDARTLTQWETRAGLVYRF